MRDADATSAPDLLAVDGVAPWPTPRWCKLATSPGSSGDLSPQSRPEPPRSDQDVYSSAESDEPPRSMNP
jgi:hypothetical protein